MSKGTCSLSFEERRILKDFVHSRIYCDTIPSLDTNLISYTADCYEDLRIRILKQIKRFLHFKGRLNSWFMTNAVF